MPEPLAGPYARFLEVLKSVERAKEAILGAVPAARHPGRPLADALFEFGEELQVARGDMAGWRAAAVESDWQSCKLAIEKSFGLAARLRTGAPDLGFEPLLAAIGDLIAPLEAFEQASERFRSLRTLQRGGRRGEAPPPLAPSS